MSQGEVTAHVEKKFKRKISKVAIIGFACFLLLGASFAIYYFKFRTAANTNLTTRTAKVSRGNISLSITGSGPLASSNKSEISPRAGGTITKVNYKEGDSVKAGDLMFELDDTDAANDVQKIYESISQAEISDRNNLTNISKLNITAPFSGQVTNISVKTGDTPNKGAAVLTITDLSKLKVQLPFNASGMNTIKPGQQVSVNFQSESQVLKGTVSDVTNKAYPTTEGGQVFDVIIILNNPGSLIQDMEVSAEIETSAGLQTSTRTGKLHYINKEVLSSKTGGTVLSVNVKENQFVSAGALLVQLENDDLQLTRETTSSKLKDLNSQLEAAKKKQDYYKVYAPIDGVITKQSIKVGDVVKSGDVISNLANNTQMQFELSVDELDIAKVQVGQKAVITIDALPETTSKPLSGSVSRIALEGTTSNGVTTYPITVAVEGNSQLKAGMNASAEIIVGERNNVLRLPIEAVQKMRNQNIVRLKVDPNSPEAKQNQAAMANGGNAGDTGNGFRGRNRNNGAGDTAANNGTGDAAGNAGAGGTAGNAGNAGGARGNNAANSGSGRNTNGSQGFSGFAGGNNPQLQQYYANSVPKIVEIGLNNEEFVEVISGLNEGDEVLLPPVTTNSGNTPTNNNTGIRMPGMGGFGGGNNSGGNNGGNNGSSARTQVSGQGGNRN